MRGCALRTRDKPFRGHKLEIRKDNLSNCINMVTKDYLVLVIPKSINTHAQSLKNITQEYPIMETSQKSTQKNSRTLIALSEDSLARLLASLVNEKDLTIPEGRYSLTLREYCEQSDLDYSSLKTLKDFSATTTETLSEPSSPRLRSWGMTVNGKCLTARITESHKTENGLSLSDILEEHPDPKYFLSETQTAKILTSSTNPPTLTIESTEQTA